MSRFVLMICKHFVAVHKLCVDKNKSVICVIKYFSCIKLIPKKKQALVEFDDVESAKNLVESSQVCGKSWIECNYFLHLRGQAMY